MPESVLDCLMYVTSFNAHNNPMKEILPLSHFTDEGTSHTEVKHLPSSGESWDSTPYPSESGTFPLTH